MLLVLLRRPPHIQKDEHRTVWKKGSYAKHYAKSEGEFRRSPGYASLRSRDNEDRRRKDARRDVKACRRTTIKKSRQAFSQPFSTRKHRDLNKSATVRRLTERRSARSRPPPSETKRSPFQVVTSKRRHRIVRFRYDPRTHSTLAVSKKFHGDARLDPDIQVHRSETTS